MKQETAICYKDGALCFLIGTTHWDPVFSLLSAVVAATKHVQLCTAPVKSIPFNVLTLVTFHFVFSTEIFIKKNDPDVKNKCFLIRATLTEPVFSP